MLRRQFLRNTLAGSALLTGCASKPKGPPNVVLILSSGLRFDGIRALGNTDVTTPNLDKLVGAGVTFSRCYTADPAEPASRAALWTASDGFHNGVRWYGDTLNASSVLLPRWMTDGGFTTFFTGEWVVGGNAAQRGFLHSGEVVSNTAAPLRSEGIDNRLFTASYRSFLASKPREPYFAVVAYAAPRAPANPPPPYDGLFSVRQLFLRHNFLPQPAFDNGSLNSPEEKRLPTPREEDAVREELARYYGSVALLDAEVGALMTAIREVEQQDNTLVFFASTAGRALGAHGLLGAGSLYDHTVRVPFIVSGPGIPRKGQRTSALCYLHDLFPSICGLAGVPAPINLDGRSIEPALNDFRLEGRSDVFSSYRDTQRMIFDGRWKLIYYPALEKQELFSIAADPDELTDVSTAPEYQNEVRDLQSRLLAHFRGEGDRAIESIANLQA